MTPTDPPTFVFVAVGLSLVALLAVTYQRGGRRWIRCGVEEMKGIADCLSPIRGLKSAISNQQQQSEKPLWKHYSKTPPVCGYGEAPGSVRRLSLALASALTRQSSRLLMPYAASLPVSNPHELVLQRVVAKERH